MKATNRWRAQKNTQSLGEYDTEEKAAQAFDRASINLAGRSARTNFDISQYEDEIDQITNHTFDDVARKLRDSAVAAAPTSNFRGVSYLTACKKWRAQININNKQYHLGYYETEEEAAKVFDRASIVRGIDKRKTRTNFDIKLYEQELPYIFDVSLKELQVCLDDEKSWKVAKQVLSTGEWKHFEEALGREVKARYDAEFSDLFSQMLASSTAAGRFPTPPKKTRGRNKRSTKLQEQQSSENNKENKAVTKRARKQDINKVSHKVQSENSLMDSENTQQLHSQGGEESTPLQNTKSNAQRNGLKLEDRSFNEQAFLGKENITQKLPIQQTNSIFQNPLNPNLRTQFTALPQNLKAHTSPPLSAYQQQSRGFAPQKKVYDQFQQHQYQLHLQQQLPSANEFLISLMTSHQFPDELIQMVQDFDTDISRVKHAGSWKILRFMIQYSPSKYDEYDEMWMKLQSLIDFVINKYPQSAPQRFC